MIWGARLNETPNNVPFYTSTNELAHALDDSRPTAGAMAGMRLTTDYEQDVFAENDYSSVTGAGGRQAAVPGAAGERVGRPYLVTEAVGTLSGPALFYRRTDPQAVQQGQATAHARVHAIAAADDRYCGVLAWSGIDYPSGSGGNIYRGVKYTGVVDLFRVAKPGAAIYQAQVDPRVKPVIAPAFYWDFGTVSPVTSLPGAMICAKPTGSRCTWAGRTSARRGPIPRTTGAWRTRRRSSTSAGWTGRRGPTCGSTGTWGRTWSCRGRWRRIRPSTGWRWRSTTPRSWATGWTRPGWCSGRWTGTARHGLTSPDSSRCRLTGRPYWSATTRSTSRRRAGRRGLDTVAARVGGDRYRLGQPSRPGPGGGQRAGAVGRAGFRALRPGGFGRRLQ